MSVDQHCPTCSEAVFARDGNPDPWNRPYHIKLEILEAVDEDFDTVERVASALGAYEKDTKPWVEDLIREGLLHNEHGSLVLTHLGEKVSEYMHGILGEHIQETEEPKWLNRDER